MKKILLISTVLLLLLLTTTCDNTPIETIEWEPDGSGFRQYKTNDPEKHWSYWIYWVSTSYQNPSTPFTVEAEVKRVSGCPGYGAEIIFCLQDPDNFYIVGIDTQGYYMAYKAVNAKWSMIRSWTFTSNLNIGFNVINNIKVTYDGSNTFTIYFNGISVDNFTDSSFSGGNAGYAVSIATESCENFPNEPVDVRYRMLQPVMDP